MIDENKTFILFGYTSDTLSFGSHKKVWKICDICKEERLIQYRYYINLCLKCSHATDDYKKNTLIQYLKKKILIGKVAKN